LLQKSLPLSFSEALLLSIKKPWLDNKERRREVGSRSIQPGQTADNKKL